MRGNDEETPMTDDGPIPGFTAPQSWVIRTVASESARLAIDELAGKPCPFACADVAELKAVTYGDGTPGLKSRVVTLEVQTADLIWYKRATIVAALGLAADIAVTVFVR
jgi:hypothetical protein